MKTSLIITLLCILIGIQTESNIGKGIFTIAATIWIVITIKEFLQKR